jgi:hypothetical protein
LVRRFFIYVRSHTSRKKVYGTLGWKLAEGFCLFAKPRGKVFLEDLSLAMRVPLMEDFGIRRNGTRGSTASLKK